MEATRRGISFRKTFFWVLVAHFVVICLISLWSYFAPTPPPPLKFLNMMAAGQLVKGTPGKSVGPIVGAKPEQPPGEVLGKPEAAAPTPAPVKNEPEPPKPVVKAKPKPKIEPKPDPIEEEVAEEISPPKPQPQPKPDSTAWKATHKPVKVAAQPTKPKVKVNLDEVAKNDGAPAGGVKTASHTTGKSKNGEPGGKAQLTAGGVAQKLGARLQASGVSTGVVRGVSGSEGGMGNSFGWYYSLIRDQMYDAWDRPLNLLGKGLTTQIQIVLEKNGTIASFSVLRSSGNPQHDESVLAAVRRVGRIRESLPEGMDGRIQINFKLTDS